MPIPRQTLVLWATTLGSLKLTYAVNALISRLLVVLWRRCQNDASFVSLACFLLVWLLINSRTLWVDLQSGQTAMNEEKQTRMKAMLSFPRETQNEGIYFSFPLLLSYGAITRSSRSPKKNLLGKNSF
jgi:hypothetical protein